MKKRQVYSFILSMGVWLITLLPFSVWAQVVINELYIAPPGGAETNSLFNICGPPGAQTLEWIELYNKSLCDTIDISCYILASNMGVDNNLCSDGLPGTNAAAYIFPQGTKVLPGGFLVIGKGGIELNPLANSPWLKAEPRWFLSNGWGWVGFFNPQGIAMNAVYWTSNQNENNPLQNNLAFASGYTIPQHPCVGEAISIKPAKELVGLIEYVGFVGTQLLGSTKAQFYRATDGSTTWKRLGPGNPTPGQCNATCAPQPDLSKISPSTYTICKGDTLNVQINQLITGNNVTYHWHANPSGFTATTPNIQVSPEVNTRYYLKTKYNYCNDIDSILVNVKPRPVADFTIDKTVACMGESVSASANNTANVQYIWDFDGGNASPGFGQGPHAIQWSTVGTKTIQLRITQSGCTSLPVNKTVTVKPSPTANFSLTPTKICQNLPIIAQYTGNATPNATYNWSFGNGSAQPGIGFGPHTVSYDVPGIKSISLSVSENGCTSLPVNQTVEITPPPTAVLNSTNSTACTGETITLSFAGEASPAAQFSWDFQGASASPGSGKGPHSLQFTTAGNKTLQVQVNDYGCTASTTLNLIINPAPMIDFDLSATSVCVGEPITLTLNGAVTPEILFNWKMPNGTPNTANGSAPVSVQYAQGGEHLIQLSITPPGCAPIIIEKTITVKDKLVNLTLQDTTICAGEKLSLQALPLDNSSPISYQWQSIPEGFIANTPTIEIYPEVNTVYFLHTQQNDCINYDTVRVTVVNVPTPQAFNLSDTLICVNQIIEVSFVPISLYNYVWDFQDAVVMPHNNRFRLHWETPGIKTVSLRYEQNGCYSYVVAQTVNVVAPPIVSIQAPQTICLTESLNFVAIGNAPQYDWVFNNQNYTGAGPFSFIMEQAGNYVVSLRASALPACTTVVKHTVSVVNPVANIQAPDTLCWNTWGKVRNTGTAGTLLWEIMGGEWDTEKQAMRWGQAGNYTLKLRVQQAHCISEPAYHTVHVLAPLKPKLTAVPLSGIAPLKINYSVTDTFYTYRWQLNDDNTIGQQAVGEYILPAGTHHLILLVKDRWACEGKDSVNIQVLPSLLYIPNAFSPNNDGENDFFTLYGIETLQSFKLSIFNRWGQLIYYTEQPAAFWDGANAPEGVYIYHIHYILNDGTPQTETGTVTLVR